MKVENLLTLKVQGNPLVYQVFIRLFENTNIINKHWDTMKDNGVGKLSDFTNSVLQGIKELGATHIWYTGVLRHDVITDYSVYGITNDDPDVVKGRAGSPYEVKYYSLVNSDLTGDTSKCLQEYTALIARTHKNGIQVMHLLVESKYRV